MSGSERPAKGDSLLPYNISCVATLGSPCNDENDKSDSGACSRFFEKRADNGDIYAGPSKAGLPDGKGKYVWADGCMYEGDWIRGKATGRGKMSWPSGTTYEGEFSGGYIQGLGTLIGKGNTSYKGSWLMNMEHGLGRKCYANGDMYEGSWNQGVRDGPGKYTWKNGNVYFGDWKGGVITGHGSLNWANKDSYHGMWLNGFEHGHGIYTWSDGSCYVGIWSQGLKDGRGTFYPPGLSPARNSSFNFANNARSNELTREDELLSSSGHEIAPLSPAGIRRKLFPLRNSESTSSGHLLVRRHSMLQSPVRVKETRREDNKLPILEREYAQGVLINELVKGHTGSMASSGSSKQIDNSGSSLRRPGETIIKGHRSYDLMLNLQLGISYSVGINNQNSEDELKPSDFSVNAKLQIKFPSVGSHITPPHQSIDFKWKDYCPSVFREIRKMFKINAADYLLSICGTDALRELSSPGKSGSVFYLSHDDRYIIKTLRRSEMKVLVKMLPYYFNHISKYENTLITKFFGLHQVTPVHGRKIQVVVMGNVFCTEMRIHRRFDLKGSLQGRSTNKVEIDETTVLKDLDLDFLFYLEPSWRKSLFEQVHEDCTFLESQQIMDYSLLLGIHFRAPQFSGVFSKSFDAPKLSLYNHVLSGLHEDQLYPKGLILVRHEFNGDDHFGPHVRGSPLKAATKEEVDLMILGTNSRLQVRLGVNMPARADRRYADSDSTPEDGYAEVYDVILYCGIIDILQKYTLAKKIEHAYKSLKFSPESISSVQPRTYSQRFQAFISNAFPDSLQEH